MTDTEAESDVNTGVDESDIGQSIDNGDTFEERLSALGEELDRQNRQSSLDTFEFTIEGRSYDVYESRGESSEEIELRVDLQQSTPY
ncbi:hypothetical protein [Halosegnis longus]|uniref:hypothetical protein n=1 Tax=Halosegnis longus TaxID=2216012 RepID=UPI00129E37BC|nr:hypothetical protein [Halosegnis longus]